MILESWPRGTWSDSEFISKAKSGFLKDGIAYFGKWVFLVVSDNFMTFKKSVDRAQIVPHAVRNMLISRTKSNYKYLHHQRHNLTPF